MELKDFTSGKSVALVGGAENYYEPDLKEYDLVVRIKNWWVKTGGRIDALYHTGEGRGFEELLNKLPTDLRFVILGVRNELGSEPLVGWCQTHSVPLLVHQVKPRRGGDDFMTGVYWLYAPILEEVLGPYDAPLAGTMCAYLVRRFGYASKLDLFGYALHKTGGSAHGHNYDLDRFVIEGLRKKKGD